MRRARREQDARAWLAWHIEALGRTKKLPKLDTLMKPQKPRRAQTVEEMASIALRWHRALTAR